MKKIIAGILLAQLFFCLYSTAQGTDVLRNELNTIFQNIDKAQIPTGYFSLPGVWPCRPRVYVNKLLSAIHFES